MKLLLYRSPNKPSPAASLRQSYFPCHELGQTLPSQEPPRLCSGCRAPAPGRWGAGAQRSPVRGGCFRLSSWQ